MRAVLTVSCQDEINARQALEAALHDFAFTSVMPRIQIGIPATGTVEVVFGPRELDRLDLDGAADHLRQRGYDVDLRYDGDEGST